MGARSCASPPGPPSRTAGRARDAAQPGDAAARGRRQREAAVLLQGFGRRAAAKNAREKNHGGSLDDRRGRAAQGVGEAHVRDVIAHANRVGQARVGIELDDELRRAAVSAEACVEAMEKLRAAGDQARLGA